MSSGLYGEKDWRWGNGQYYPRSWSHPGLRVAQQDSISPVELKEREPGLPIATEDLTSSRQYIQMLGKALGKSERHVHRLRKQLGDINIELINSHCTSLVLYPGGGKQHIPLPSTTKSYRLVEPRWGIREVGSNLKIKHRYLLLDVDPKLSGKPLMVESYLWSEPVRGCLTNQFP